LTIRHCKILAYSSDRLFLIRNFSLSEQLDSPDCRMSALGPNLATDRRKLKLGSPTPIPPDSSQSSTGIEFPLKKAKSVEGIISYLTRKHGGNVHDEGIVTITAKSIVDDRPKYAKRNVADLTSNSTFDSRFKTNPWIC
jgi:hypothetical protein